MLWSFRMKLKLVHTFAAHKPKLTMFDYTFRVYIHFRFKQAVLVTPFSCLYRTVSYLLLVVRCYWKRPLQIRSGLEPGPRCEPSTSQPISRRRATAPLSPVSKYMWPNPILFFIVKEEIISRPIKTVVEVFEQNRTKNKSLNMLRVLPDMDFPAIRYFIKPFCWDSCERSDKEYICHEFVRNELAKL